MEQTLEELYNLKKKEVGLKRVSTKSGKWLEIFPSPGPVLVTIDFPEFTCRCPKSGNPDFATITLKYIPNNWCVELKSLKYYYNSFRDEGHFHEEIVHLIEQDLRDAIIPRKLTIIGEFNVRGGAYPTIFAGDYPVGEEE
jgi:7-cyano-7-deazaguanine reductase